MIFRNSLKSIFRTPVKSILLLLLAAAVTAFACLGLGMRHSTMQLLQEADSEFRTTAVLEYIGKNYPDVDEIDSEMAKQLSEFQLIPLTSRPEVISYDTQLALGGSIPNLRVNVAGERKYEDEAVVRFKVMYSEGEELRCLILDTLYSSPDYKAGRFFNLDMAEDVRTILKKASRLPVKDGVYLASGTFGFDSRRILRFYLLPFVNAAMPEDPALLSLMKCPIVDLTGQNTENYEYVMGYDGLRKIAEACQVLNNNLPVSAADDPASFLCFQEQETYLTSGRFLTAEDRGQQLCMVSDYLCQQMGCSLGDTIELDLYGAIGSSPIYECWWPDTGYLHQGEYRIAGTFKETSRLNYRIFIPKDETWMPTGNLDSTICRFRLDNAGASTWQEKVKPYLLPEMKISLFDQGYGGAVSTLNTMQREANLLLAVSGASTLAVLLLLVYLFVSKQRAEIRTMRCLGAGRKRIIGYLLFSILLLTFFASILGMAAGYLASGCVMDSAYNRAVSAQVGDGRYSNAAAVGEQLDFNMHLHMPSIDPPMAAAAVLGTALILTGIFSLSITRDRALRRPVRQIKKRRVIPLFMAAPEKEDAVFVPLQLETLEIRTAIRESSMFRAFFPVKMALRAIRRSGGKNLISVLMSLCMVVLIGAFSAGIMENLAEKESIYDAMPVTAYMTNYSGKQLKSLNLSINTIQLIENTGYVEQTNMSIEKHCQLLGLVRHADGTPAPDPGGPDIPQRGYAAETFDDSISSMDSLVFTNSLQYAPAYFFEEDVPFSFLEGYDMSAFAGDEPVCAVSQDYMEAHGLILGDVIRLTALQRNPFNPALGAKYWVLEEKIIAKCPKLQGGETVYVPLSGIKQSTYDSVSFLLKNIRGFSIFKDKLERAGVTPVGKVGAARVNIVVRDQKLYETLNNLTRHIGYMQALNVGVYVLSIAMGFVVSYLLTRTRRPELAILRSTGAGWGRAFEAFFIEQGILCILGAVAGLLLTELGIFGSAQGQIPGVLLYVCCYLTGVAAAICMMERGDVLSIMGARE